MKRTEENEENKGLCGMLALPVPTYATMGRYNKFVGIASQEEAL